MDSSKRTEWILGIIVILLTGILSAGYSYAENVKSKENNSPVIVIDAGHGGYDPGKIAINDALEKDINLLIANYLQEHLENKGFSVVMTRTTDTDLQSGSSYRKTEDLSNRCRIIESSDADYAISIHQNSYTDSNVSGAQVFYYSSSKEGEELAKSIQTSLKENVDAANERKAKNSESYYILKKSSCPTVIVECGFLSNRTEADKLCDEEYQKKIAKAICEGFINFHEKVSE